MPESFPSEDLPAVVNEVRKNGVAYYAVEGDRCTGITVQGGVSHEWCGQGVMPCYSERRPPSEWVALAEAKCETCSGEILLPSMFGIDPLGLRRCPDCVDGKPKHTLTVDRPPKEFRQLVSRRGGYEGVFSWFTGDERICDHEHGESEDWLCEDARTWPRTVSVDVVVRAVLPVGEMAPANDYDCGFSDVDHVCISRDCIGGVAEDSIIIAEEETEDYITPLGPDLKPGMFVAVICIGGEA